MRIKNIILFIKLENETASPNSVLKDISKRNLVKKQPDLFLISVPNICTSSRTKNVNVYLCLSNYQNRYFSYYF